MKLFMGLVGIVLLGILLSYTMVAMGGDYKAYQDRSLSNTLQLQRPDLSEAVIEKLINLPRVPQIAPSGDSLFITDAEWFFLSEDEIIGIHFRGCRGKLVFNLADVMKKK